MRQRYANTGLDDEWSEGRIATAGPEYSIDIPGGGGKDNHAEILRVGDTVQCE